LSTPFPKSIIKISHSNAAIHSQKNPPSIPKQLSINPNYL
jgi:hypothetical protein